MNKNIKKAFSVILSFAFFALCGFIFSGCTYKTYKLAGVVDEATGKVTPIESVDEDTIFYIRDTLGVSPTISLKANGVFFIEYSIYDAGLEVSYKQTGTYKINEEERTITFSFPKEGGGTTDTIQQYENGKIVYFDGVNFLVFN